MPSQRTATPRLSSSNLGIDIDALSDTLCELGRVERLEQLGNNGPLVASAGAEVSFIACSA